MVRNLKCAIACTVAIVFFAGSLSVHAARNQYPSERLAESIDRLAIKLAATEHEQKADDAELQRQRKHDDDDLIAQFRAANAATESANLAKWQLLLSTLGTVALMIALFQTNKSVRVAEKGIKHAQDTAKAQLRAYLSVDVDLKTLAIDSVKDALTNKVQKNHHFEGVRFETKLKNTGLTPAYIKDVRQAVVLVTAGAVYSKDKFHSIHADRRVITLGGGETLLGREDIITRTDVIKLVNKEIDVYFAYEVLYEDIDGTMHTTSSVDSFEFWWDVESSERNEQHNWYDLKGRVYRCQPLAEFAASN